MFRTGNCYGIFGGQFPLLFLDVSYNLALSSIQGCEILLGCWKMLACLAALVLITKETWAHIFPRSCLPLGWKSLWKMNRIWISLYLALLFTLCDDVWSHHSIIKLWNLLFLFSTLVTHKKMINYAINWPWSERRARKKLSTMRSRIQLRDLLSCCVFLFSFSFLFLFTIIEDH